MLTSNERTQLKDRDALTPKVRGNLIFRLSQKTKNRLKDLAEVDEALHLLSPKNARRLVTDEMIVAALKLSEDLIKLMGYAPVEEGPRGQLFVCTTQEISSPDRDTHRFEVERRPPTPLDVARHRLLKDHIEALQRIAQPVAAALEGPLAELPNLNRGMWRESDELYKIWRPDLYADKAEPIL